MNPNRCHGSWPYMLVTLVLMFCTGDARAQDSDEESPTEPETSAEQPQPEPEEETPEQKQARLAREREAALLDDDVPTGNIYASMSLEQLLSLVVFSTEQTVSTATMTERKIEETPAIITVFTKDDILRLGARNLADLLQYVPGFYEVSTQLGRNYAIRGIHASTAQHFVILQDGLPVNDFVSSMASPDTFSLDQVEQVEVIRGPGSAIYGASALMGVVNLITKTGFDQGHVQETLHVGNGIYVMNSLSGGADLGNDTSLFFSTNVWHNEGTRYTVGGDEDVLMPRLGQNIYDGFQQGENLNSPRAETPVRVNRYGPSLDLYLRVLKQDDWLISVNLASTEQYLQRTYLQTLVDVDHEIQIPKYLSQRLVFRLEKSFGQTGRNGRFTIRGAVVGNTHKLKSQRISTEFFGVDQIVEFPELAQNAVAYSWSGADLRFLPTLEYSVDPPDLGIFRKNNLIVSVQPEYNVAYDYRQTNCYLDSNQEHSSTSVFGAEHDLACEEEVFLNEGLEIDPYDNATDSDTTHLGDGDEWRGGGFLQYSTFFPNDIGLVLGSRLDYHPTYKLQFSPRAAVVAPLPGGLYSKLQYSRAFIYPAFLYLMGNSRAPYGADPDGPEIDPQSIDSVELLLGLKSKVVRVEFNGFYNRVQNFITYDVIKNAQTGRYEYSNQGDLNIIGVENTTRLDIIHGRLGLDLNATLTYPIEQGTDDTYLVDGRLGGPTKFPLFMGGLAINVVPFRAFNINARFLYADQVVGQTVDEIQYYDIEGTDGELYSSRAPDEYQTRTFLLNATISYTFLDRLRVGVDGYNLLNRRHYRPGSVAVPMLLDGIKVVGSVSYEF